MREQAKGLDVEEEAGWGSLYPEMGVAFRRQSIVGRVHVDDGKLAGVVGEPVGGGPAHLRDRRYRYRRPVGPAAGAS